VAIAPRFRLDVTRYSIVPPHWPEKAGRLRIVVVADVHACEPWMPLSRIADIVALCNNLKPDLIVLLGDYVAGIHRRYLTGIVSPSTWGPVLSRLAAPLGRYAILGNHDWWDDIDAVRAALTDNGIPLLENRSVRVEPARGPALWLAGLGDQWALGGGDGKYRGVDDLRGTLAAIPEDGNPILLLAHEPDIFPRVPDRVSLTLSGHTHGGQVVLPFIGRLVVPSAYGNRYAYGHIIEGGRHLIVSGGIGCSWLPVRFRVPPEIVVLDIESIDPG